MCDLAATWFTCIMLPWLQTPMNMASTRSHCIFTVYTTVRDPGSNVIRKSKLHLVDLAGYGEGGPVTLYGEGGPVTLYGEGVPVTLYGEGGPVTLYGEGVPVTLYGEGGPVTFYGEGGLVTLYWEGGPVTLYGEGGPGGIEVGQTVLPKDFKETTNQNNEVMGQNKIV